MGGTGHVMLWVTLEAFGHGVGGGGDGGWGKGGEMQWVGVRGVCMVRREYMDGDMVNWIRLHSCGDYTQLRYPSTIDIHSYLIQIVDNLDHCI